MLDAERIAYLQSEAGAELLAQAAALSGDFLRRLTRLRRRYPPELAAAALQLLGLRERARTKFSRAADMSFTPEGLEQASGEIIARWRAARFPVGATVLDLCCGIGGDTLVLAARGPVLAFDTDPAALLCARANARAYDVGDALALARIDVAHLRLPAVPTTPNPKRPTLFAFFDPSRRRAGRRVRDAGLYTPPLDFLHTLRAHIPDCAAKVSPALDDETLHSFGGRVEFVSDRGECKEAVLWFGGIGPAARRSATVLPVGASLAADPDAPPPALTPPRGWLYEPDAAVVRAHLLAELAQHLNASLVSAQIAYLTADEPQPTPFATAYRILEWMPFNLKRLRLRLREKGWRATAVKRRGVPLEPADIGRALPTEGDRPVVVVLTRIAETAAVILCEARSDSDS